MRAKRYRLWSDPRKGTLTRAIIRRGDREAAETEVFCSLLEPGATVFPERRGTEPYEYADLERLLAATTREHLDVLFRPG